MNAEAYLMPLTLCSGMIEGVEQWESYKALRRAMKTGKAEDVRAVGAAIVKDMSDQEKARAYTEGTRQAEIGMRAAEILKRDKGELAEMMNEAGKAFREAKAAKKRKSEIQAKWKLDHKRHLEAVAKLSAGADEKALSVIGETSKAIARYRKEAEECNQEYKEKRAEADRLYQNALSIATGQAKREMMIEAQRKKTRRRKPEENAENNENGEMKRQKEEHLPIDMEQTEIE